MSIENTKDVESGVPLATSNDGDDNDDDDDDIEKNTTTQRNGDLTVNEISDHVVSEHNIMLNLPVHDKTRSVSGLCAICLEDYKVNDTIAFSSNSECIHCFHEQCFTEASVKLMKESTVSWPCPICRQTFIEEEASDNKNESSRIETRINEL